MRKPVALSGRCICVGAAVLLVSCGTRVVPHPESAMVSVEVSHERAMDTRPVGAALTFQPKFAPGVMRGTNTVVRLLVDEQQPLLAVKAKVNGVEGRFAIDTAAPHTVFTPAFLDKAMPSSRTSYPVERVTQGVTQSLECVPVFSLAVGGVIFTDFDAVISPEAHGADGIIGANLLTALPVTIDCPAMLLSFALPSRTAAWHRVRFVRQSGSVALPVTTGTTESYCVLDPCTPHSCLAAATATGGVAIGGTPIDHNVPFVAGRANVLGFTFFRRYAIALIPGSGTVLFQAR